MTTLNITPDDLAQVTYLMNQGNISDAWKYLGERGDAYAYVAGAVVSTDTASMTWQAKFFYSMVKYQWSNTAAGNLWQTPVFFAVGKQHLTNYIKFLTDHIAPGGGYTLPTTIEIEASYKDALERNSVLPITAIDSLFSVLDTAAGNANGSVLRVKGVSIAIKFAQPCHAAHALN